MTYAALLTVSFASQAIVPESASGWLRFGITALPKTAPPLPSS
jgi:hypothetical protein